MSEYIINPSWFYWASVLNSVRVAFFVISVVGLIVGAVMTILYVSDEGDFGYLAKKKWFWVLWSVGIFLFIVALFMPSKEVMIQMMVARYLTHENIAYSVETIKEIADYILQAVGK